MQKLMLAAAIAAAVFAPAYARDTARYQPRSQSQDRSQYQSRSPYQSQYRSQSQSQSQSRYQSRPQALPACDGHYATIRTSEVKAGKWDQFQAAVTAHRAWYAQHGKGATVSLARVVRGGKGGGDFADGQAVTITVFRDPAARTLQHDAAWAQFVADYQASSRVTEERRVCLPSLS